MELVEITVDDKLLLPLMQVMDLAAFVAEWAGIIFVPATPIPAPTYIVTKTTMTWILLKYYLFICYTKENAQKQQIFFDLPQL